MTPPSARTGRTRTQRTFAYLHDLARHGGRQLVRDRAPQLAAALSYRTVFSLIPVLVLSLIALKAFYGEQGIRELLDRVMVYLGFSELSVSAAGVEGSEEVRVQFTRMLEEFIGRATESVTQLNFRAITIVSVGLFLYAAISLLIQIEQAFNQVCKAGSGRRLISRLTTYWTLLTLGSVGLVSSLFIGDQLAGAVNRLPEWLSWAATPLGISIQLGATWLLFLLAYTRMPNTRVELIPAAIGALFAGLLWEGAKWGLSNFVGLVVKGHTAVYGPLALIPIVLLWIYVTWLIVLFGLEITYAVQTLRADALHRRLTYRGSGVVDNLAAVAVMREIARDFNVGRTSDPDRVAARCGLPESVVDTLCDRLREVGLVRRVESERGESCLSLARPAESITAAEILAATRIAPEQEPNQAMAKIIAVQQGALESVKLSELTPGGAPA